MVQSSAPSESMRRLRLRAGLSQELLAERCRVSVRTIRSMESGTPVRPRRDTLLALAAALGLAGAARDDFVELWRSSRRPISELFAGSSPQESVQQAFARQRERVHDLAISDTAVIGPDRRWVSATIRRTFETRTEGVDSLVWMRSFDASAIDPARFGIGAVVNAEVVSTAFLPSANATVFEASLGRTLAVGEVYTVEYTLDFHSAYRPDVGDIDADVDTLMAVAEPTRSMFSQVRFDPAAVPVRAWRVRHETLDGPATALEPLTVSPFGVVSAYLSPAPFGVHGIRWDWGDDG